MNRRSQTVLIVIVVLAIVTFLTCCNNSTASPDKLDSPAGNVHAFNLAQHSYLIFSGDGRISSQTVVHNPDCVCQKRKKVQQNYFTFKYIDWFEGIDTISRDFLHPTLIKAYIQGDSIYLAPTDVSWKPLRDTIIRYRPADTVYRILKEESFLMNLKKARELLHIKFKDHGYRYHGPSSSKIRIRMGNGWSSI